MPVSCPNFILLIRENKFTLTTTRISPDTRARELSSLVSETRVETSQLNLGDVRNRWVIPDTKIVLCRDAAVKVICHISYPQKYPKEMTEITSNM